MVKRNTRNVYQKRDAEEEMAQNRKFAVFKGAKWHH